MVCMWFVRGNFDVSPKPTVGQRLTCVLAGHTQPALLNACKTLN